ncbi:MAG: LysM peptidoglycan-binding domain-containing protein [Kiritimatiellia bacterium]|nr:LysM peptidoglycan-binding domain-containing protein [Kiritimatiellia bacterium]
MKKILALMTVVIGVHCVAITALFLIQGCKTAKPTGTSASQTPVMPPLSAPAVTPVKVEPATVAGKAEETIEYTVKSGDALGLIAKRHNVSKGELTELNKLADPNKIRIGQKLIIPKRSQAVVTPAPKAVAAKKPKEKKSEPATTLATELDKYVVQAGDNLSKIAAKLNVKTSELREVNKLVNDKLRIGQKLIIPGAKKAESVPEPAATPAVTGDVSPAAAPEISDTGITHVVMPNEDLSSIAKLYAVTVEGIITANQLGTNRTVQAGQKIIIP